MTAKPLPTGGIFSKLVRANKLADKWGLNIVIYGESNVGKTRFGASAQDDPQMADVVIFDWDGGARTVIDRDDVTIFSSPSFSDLALMYTAINTKEHPFRTFVFDTMSSWYRLSLEAACKLTGQEHPGPREYGIANEWILKAVSQWRSLAQNHGWTVVFNAHSKVETLEEEQRKWRQAAMTPGLYQGMAQIVDVIALYEKVGKNRVMRFYETSTVLAKARLPESWPKPPEKLINPTITDLRKVLSMGLLSPEETAELQSRYAAPPAKVSTPAAASVVTTPKQVTSAARPTPLQRA